MRWRKPRPIQVVALVGSVLAASTVLVMFNRMSGFMGRTKAEPQLVATVDLRLGNPMFSAQRGETEARADIEAGLLQLQTFTPEASHTREDAARARQLKQRFGVAWLHKKEAATPFSQAYVDGYNRVMRAELERRHGRAAVGALLPKDEAENSGGPHP